MKKVVVYIIALLYIWLSTGAIVHMHYCMGKFVGSSLWSNNNNETEVCGKCNMSQKASKHKCCKDEKKLVKVVEDQKIADSVYQISQLNYTGITLNYFTISETPVPSQVQEKLRSNSPPVYYRVPIYIRNSVFRI